MLDGCSSTQRYGYEQYDKIAQHGQPMLKELYRAYLASVAFADAQLGVVLDALEENDHAKNTHVVVTADHGYHLGEHEIWFKHSLFEEATRVSLIWNGPGVHHAALGKAPVSHVDLYPTFIDVFGLEDNPNQMGNWYPLDGKSMSNLLSQPETECEWLDRSVYSVVSSNDHLEEGEPADLEKQAWAVLNHRWRYHSYPSGEQRLYDIENDSYELNDLSESDDHQIRSTMELMANDLQSYLGARERAFGDDGGPGRTSGSSGRSDPRRKSDPCSRR